MKEAKIQTLHPERRKKNKPIPREKYERMKAAMLDVLQYVQLTHTELMAELTRNLKDRFEDNISWYAMTVKLDLEAWKIIGRTTSKPPKYRIREANRLKPYILNSED